MSQFLFTACKNNCSLQRGWIDFFFFPLHKINLDVTDSHSACLWGIKPISRPQCFYYLWKKHSWLRNIKKRSCSNAKIKHNKKKEDDLWSKEDKQQMTAERWWLTWRSSGLGLIDQVSRLIIHFLDHRVVNLSLTGEGSAKIKESVENRFLFSGQNDTAGSIILKSHTARRNVKLFRVEFLFYFLCFALYLWP